MTVFNTVANSLNYLVMEALQDLRIKYRWEEIEKENQAIKIAKEQNLKYIPLTFDNDDSPKQLLAKSRYIMAKKPNQWTENQKIRAELLFRNYPLLHQAYKHTLEFRTFREGHAIIKEVLAEFYSFYW
ncbi:hypothetical protein IA05_10835 [Flavobacterium psychrophilum]|uniref:transposase n=1 Tax=Flavobacterium psychrophilum TaxID=96345 RepID=UPI0004D19086|nr:transposase [Flavobacterium psychrophilum]AIG39980.1 hypothetical protein IA05_10835 [Flavobacterium psychrophilum]